MTSTPCAGGSAAPRASMPITSGCKRHEIHLSRHGLPGRLADARRARAPRHRRASASPHRLRRGCLAAARRGRRARRRSSMPSSSRITIPTTLSISTSFSSRAGTKAARALFVVHAPASVITHMRRILEAYADERALRIVHERRPSRLGLEVEFHELTDGRAIRVGDLEAEAFAVDHRPVAPAFGLILRQRKTRIVFSGDTRPVPSLVEAARGAELLVCEVFVDREMMPAQGVRSAETIAAVKSYHLTPRQIAKAARAADVAALALTHFVPPNADRPALLAEIRKGYRGPVVLGEDLMSIDPRRRARSLSPTSISPIDERCLRQGNFHDIHEWPFPRRPLRPPRRACGRPPPRARGGRDRALFLAGRDARRGEGARSTDLRHQPEPAGLRPAG